MFNAIKNIAPLLFLLILVSTNAEAQRSATDTIKVRGYITAEGDTIAFNYLEPVTVYARISPQMRKYLAEWTRLRNAVYVTYPYAKAASKIMNEINVKLVGVTDRKQRRVIIRSREKELKKEFTEKLTNLSIYQGKVLMKLIYRETGNNCYEIIDEYKGHFTAAFYQTIAFFFGTSLKQNYDPVEKDKDMETIVRDVQKMYGYKG